MRNNKSHSDRKADRERGLALLNKLEDLHGNLTHIHEDDPRLVVIRELMSDPLDISVYGDMEVIKERIHYVSRKQNITKKKIYAELCEICDLPYNIVVSRINSEGSFALRDLKAIAKYLEIPLEEVVLDDKYLKA